MLDKLFELVPLFLSKLVLSLPKPLDAVRLNCSPIMPLSPVLLIGLLLDVGVKLSKFSQSSKKFYYAFFSRLYVLIAFIRSSSSSGSFSKQVTASSAHFFMSSKSAPNLMKA